MPIDEIIALKEQLLDEITNIEYQLDNYAGINFQTGDSMPQEDFDAWQRKAKFALKEKRLQNRKLKRIISIRRREIDTLKFLEHSDIDLDDPSMLAQIAYGALNTLCNLAKDRGIEDARLTETEFGVMRALQSRLGLIDTGIGVTN